MKRRILSFFCAFMILFSVIPQTAYAVKTSGEKSEQSGNFVGWQNNSMDDADKGELDTEYDGMLAVADSSDWYYFKREYKSSRIKVMVDFVIGKQSGFPSPDLVVRLYSGYSDSYLRPTNAEIYGTTSNPTFQYTYEVTSESSIIHLEISKEENNTKAATYSFRIQEFHEHSYEPESIEPTCTAVGGIRMVCECGDKGSWVTVTDKLGHEIVDAEPIPPTCSQPGKAVGGKKCERCGVYTLEPEVIPATGKHTEVTIEGKAANCTETGLTEGKKCTVCGKVTVEQQTIPTNDQHGDPITGEDKDPTCTETGMEDVKECSRCAKILSFTTVPTLGGHVLKDMFCTRCGEGDPEIFTASGTEDNIKWGVDKEGYLRLYGSGEMNDYEKDTSGRPPWWKVRDEIKYIVIEEGITYLSAWAFGDLVNATGIDIPGSVTSIGPLAFRNCSNFLEVNIPDSVELIDFRAFSGCEKMVKVTLPEGLKHTDINGSQETFEECSSLVEVNLPNEWERLKEVFRNCTSLESIIIPQNVKDFAGFYGCTNLKTIYIQGKMTSVVPADWGGVKATVYYPEESSWLTKFSYTDANLTWVLYDPCEEHTFGPWEPKTEGSCTKPGTEISRCTGCEVTKIRVTDVDFGHSWDEGKVTKPATEEAEGELTRTCEICGATETEAIPKLEPHEHAHIKTEEVPATCTEKGYSVYKCDCGDEYRGDETEPAGHKWNAGEVTKEATEEAEGELTRTCEVCGATETEAIPKLEAAPDPGAQRTPGEEWEYGNDGAGKNDALTTAEEILAGQTYRGRVGKGDFTDWYKIPVSGGEVEFTVTLWSTSMHILEDRGLEIQFYDADGKTVKPDNSSILTRDLEGVLLYDFLYTYKFAAGSAVQYVEFSVENAEKGNGYSFKAEAAEEAPHEHDYEETVIPASCTEKGYTVYKCDCGDEYRDKETDLADHTWNEGEVTKEATEEAEGELKYTCDVCKATKTEVIPKLESHEHDYSYRVDVKTSTCEEEGYTIRTCSCGAIRVENKMPAMGHLFFEGVCAVCGERDPGQATPTEPTEPENPDGDSGVFGSLTWTLDGEGVLTISGTGAMPYCQMESEVPWMEYAEDITKAVIQDGVTSIGAYAFYNCLNLEDVEIGSSVTQIHNAAFYGCRSLKTVEIPDTVVSIGNEAFYNCDSLQSIDLGEGVLLLGRNTFDMCRSLTEITIPESVVSIDSYCFQSCEGLREITFRGNAPSFGGNVFSGVGIFPSETATCYYPEGNNTWTDSVMQNMGGRLVWKAYGKQEEETPAIGGACGNDMRWTLDEATGTLTISGNGDMNNVSSMIYSPWYAYRDQIRNVVIEEGVVSVGDNMLSGLHALTEVVFPDSLRFIGKGAFSMDTSLRWIDLSGLESIFGEAFSGCTSLKEVTLPENVNIGDRLFRDCTGLEKVTVCANSQEALGHGFEMFAGCTALTDVVLEDGVGSISQYMFANCTALEKITIPSSVEVIAANAFQDCTALRDVTLESGVGEIGASAFRGCLSLTSFTFPAVVGPVSEAVFNYCENLETIRFEGDAPEISGSAFSTLKVTAYYPSGNETWNDDTLRYYGSTLIDWVPYGHEHSYTSQVVAPTCTAEGYTIYTCSCGYSYTGNKTSKTDHTEKRIPGKEATCTESGFTDSTACSVCETVIVQPQIVPAKGHEYEDGSCIRCKAKDPDYTPPTQPTEPSEPGTPVTGNVTRLSGLSRYETSFAIANEMKKVLGVEKFDSIILASSEGFADALAGSYLAAVKQAPIIIGKLKYAGIVCDYVNANLASGGTVYVLGGEGAVPEAMLGGITVTDNFERLAGNDRYITNLEILAEAGVAGKDILVATGQDFADSLSASATGLPILLVNGKAGKTLSDAQKAFLASVDGEIYIIGGESAVPASMVEQIEAASGKETTRIAGNSRYETSIEIAKQFLGGAESAVVAYASTFPDGLCGGPLAYAVKAPLILTKDGKTEAPNYTTGNNITSGYVLGGDGLISDDFAKTIFQITEILK